MISLTIFYRIIHSNNRGQNIGQEILLLNVNVRCMTVISCPGMAVTVQWVLSARPNFYEASISLPSSNMCDYICEAILLPNIRSYHMQWRVKLNLRWNYYYYRLCDQRIPSLQGFLGELHRRSAAMSS